MRGSGISGMPKLPLMLHLFSHFTKSDAREREKEREREREKKEPTQVRGREGGNERECSAGAPWCRSGSPGDLS